MVVNAALELEQAAVEPDADPHPDDDRRDELLKQELAALDAALAVESDPDEARRDELLEQGLTAIDAAPAVQTPLTPRPSIALAPAPYPVVPVPSVETLMRFAAEFPAEADLESCAPRIGMDFPGFSRHSARSPHSRPPFLLASSAR